MRKDGFVSKVTLKRYSGEFRSRVALKEVPDEQTLSELASKHGKHQKMIAQWKCQTLEGMAATFSH
ncbi:transposase [Gluconobacter kondonii]|uniref:transposase n=1 Tax=Gluconobacter kondonii TaxID=941463 RepID=UPI0038CF4293